ncbi:MAG: sulfite reductase subunit alpha [Opitutaceae bacterium]|jgi:sulfite reductase (NADPH) flavoprotein alpha-component|nr:sulfite reductase subunit alpha [Opitutaceae bacterium]
MTSTPVASLYNKDNPFPAKISENRLLGKPGSGKETRHFAINLEGSGLTYKAGDSIGVQPTNRPGEVAEIIQLLGASGDEPVLPAMLKLAQPIGLREALSARLSLAGPTRRALELLQAKTTDAAERARLAALLAPEAREALQAFLDERAYVDLLAEFPSGRAGVTPQELVGLMRKLMPRLYSIASSPKAFPQEAHLTVAILRYRSNGRDRVGVCSTFLADRAAVRTTPVPVFISGSHFGPPADPAADAIMVGPGTGVAPFRAFVQERAAAGASGRNWLFFGDRNKASDFLYEEEWAGHLAGGRLARLDLAWSRDQERKIYVQDRMRENAAELWAWIRNGAHFYVCGDAKRMAKDVDAALHEIIARQGGMDAAASADYVKAMKKDKRYQRDVY